MNFLQKLDALTSLSRRGGLMLNQKINFCSSNDVVAESLEKDRLYSRLEIELKGIEPEVMKSYAWYATTSAQHLGIQVGKCFALRKSEKDRWTVLKSVHVHRKHLVQYEARTYYRFLNFHNLTQSTMETFLEYIQRNLPEGTAMKATKIEIQSMPEHIQKAIESNSSNSTNLS